MTLYMVVLHGDQTEAKVETLENLKSR